MKTIIKRLLFILMITIPIFSQDLRYIFVVDGSGSMDGKGIMQANDAMLKLAKSLMTTGGKVSIIVGNDTCGSQPRIESQFIDNLQDLRNILNRIKTDSGDNITLGFMKAQEIMSSHNYEGHIYLFGDCDGLTYCESIESIANGYMKKGKLTPFTYLFVDGCTEEEKTDWNKMISKISGAHTGAAASFDYNKIIQKPLAVKMKKNYFSSPKFVNKDGTENSGVDYRTNPWRCVESDGLMWYVINKKEQDFDFFMKEPATNAFYQKTKNNILVADYLGLLDQDNVCGKQDWRLPDLFELQRITQIGYHKREKLFPYLKIWPHISVTAGKHNGFRKGIDFNNGQVYEYREDRPYAAIFVSGQIDTSLFRPPAKMLQRYKVTNKTMSQPLAKQQKNDDIIDQIIFDEKNDVEPKNLVESDVAVINGIDVPVTIVVHDGEVSVNNGKWQKGSVQVFNGDKIKLRHMSGSGYNEVKETTVTSGIWSTTFRSVTRKKTLSSPIKTKQNSRKANINDFL